MLVEDTIYTIDQPDQMNLLKIIRDVKALPSQSTRLLMDDCNDTRGFTSQTIKLLAQVVNDNQSIGLNDFTKLSNKESKKLTDLLNHNVDHFYYEFYPEFANTFLDYKITGFIHAKTTNKSYYLGVLFSYNHPDVSLGVFICTLLNDKPKLQMYISQSQLDHLETLDHFNYELQLIYNYSDEFNDLKQRTINLLTQK